MDETESPTIIPHRLVEKDVKPSPVAGAVKLAGTSAVWCLGVVGAQFTTAGAIWKEETDRRNEARTDEARAAVRETNMAYLDAMRTLRRDRRLFEQARSEVPWWHVFNGERRAARIVARDSAAMAREAKAARTEARKAYPKTLAAVAARFHVLHAAPAALWCAVADGVAPIVAASTSATAIAANVAVAWLGQRNVAGAWLGQRNVAAPVAEADTGALQPSREEADLLRRLQPEEWHTVAEPRGLVDAVSQGATLTATGIQAKFALNRTLDLKTLQGKEAQLRAALRLPEGVRMELREGKSGGYVRMTLRTRSTADLGDTLWDPNRPGIGVDVVTGDIVDVPVTGVHSMTGGRTNMGKSAYARIQLMRTCQSDLLAGVVLDPKRAEAYTWRGKIRTAGECADVDRRDEDIYSLLCELMAEFRHRQTKLEGLSWKATPEYPDLFISIDEGAALVRLASIEQRDENGKKHKPYEDALTMAETLYGEARVVGMWFNWISQYLAKGSSIPQLVKENVGAVIGLTTKGQEGDRMLFDETAGRTGWSPSEKCGGVPGRALVGYKNNPANPVQLWHVTEETIRALPDAEPWRSRAPGYNGTRATKADVQARKSLEASGDPWAATTVLDTTKPTSGKKVRVSAEDRDDQILEELTVDPCRSLSSIAAALGASKAVIKRRLEQMEADGLVCRDEDQCWHPVR